ncbi:MAG: protein kinase [Minicystis sp.]
MIGETLGHRYTLIRLLGQGGMGSVYEAEARETGERVAVKVLHSHLLLPGGVGPRGMRRELQAARAIHGDHVARVIDGGTDEATGHLYLVTELLDGEDLQRLLDRVGPLAPETALRVAAQALAGLAAAHAGGVVHRDIKPANLFLARGPGGAVTVKVLDFGIAKLRPDPLSASGTTAFTTTGTLLGSPLYMSPEQVQSSRDVDHRTDLWSMGCVLYAMLTGRAPHARLASVGQILVAVCTSPPPPLREIAPWVPPEVAGMVHRALAHHPAERPASAAALLAEIRRIAPEATLTTDLLAPCGQAPREVSASVIPPSASQSRVIVAPAFAQTVASVAGDEATEHGAVDPRLTPRSAEPPVRVGRRFITVDPRRILGDASEIWTFSCEVHPTVSSLVARVYRSLRRAGAQLPTRSYGTKWVLFEPRTERAVVEQDEEGSGKQTLGDAGIGPGTVLWAMLVDLGEAEGMKAS